HLDLHSFPTRRSSDLFIRLVNKQVGEPAQKLAGAELQDRFWKIGGAHAYLAPSLTGWQRETASPVTAFRRRAPAGRASGCRPSRDRKSTRLNSSHVEI